MTLQEFNSLSKKYVEGKTSDAENQILLEWLENQKLNDDEINKAIDTTLVQKRMWTNINKELSPKKKVNWLKLSLYSGIAASILILITINFSISKDKHKNLAENKTLEVSNQSEKPEVIVLSDGTEVYLAKNSSISYGKDFNVIKREVYLKGNAFFKVKRDVNKLFIVHSQGLSAEVLGTSFWVKENKKNKSIEVEVTTGKVSVYTDKKSIKNEKNGVILTPNQKVTYDPISQNIKQGLIEFPKPIVTIESTTPKMVFQSIALNDVLKEFSAIYGIDFIVSNERLNTCKITADLNGLEMYMQLELICKSIDAKYEKRGTVIFLDGEGC